MEGLEFEHQELGKMLSRVPFPLLSAPESPSTPFNSPHHHRFLLSRGGGLVQFFSRMSFLSLAKPKCSLVIWTMVL
jgi:hypothetical protein